MNKSKSSVLVLLAGFALSNLLFSGLITWLPLKPLAFIALIMVPGQLLAFLLNIEGKGKTAFAFGLGLSFLMAAGLVLNCVLPPLFGVQTPLRLAYLLPVIDILMLVMGLVVWRQQHGTQQESFSVRLQRLVFLNNKRSYVLLALYLLAPLISAGGAIRLNNGAGNGLAICLIVGLMILWAVTALWKSDNDKLYPIALYSSALTLLLMFSLRSNYVTGYDVQAELHVFRRTALNYHWVFGSERDAYNATLSLTILPTIFKEFLHVNYDTVFKFYYQVLAAGMASITYLFSRNFITTKKAFLVSLFFIVQPQFLQEMPALNRQEISFIFFLLFLCAMFQGNLSRNAKRLLFLLFGFSLIVSHYSTAYVSLAVLILAYLLSRLLRRFSTFKEHSYKGMYPSGIMLIVLLIGALFWYGQITNNVHDLSQAVRGSITNLAHISSEEQRSSSANQIIGKSSTSNGVLVSSYRANTIKNSQLSTDPLSSSILQPVSPQQDISKNADVGDGVSAISGIAQKAFKILLVVGFIFYIVNILRRRKLGAHDALFLIISVSFALLAFLAVILPNLSKVYNFDRLYQQALPFFGAIMIVGITGLASRTRFRRYALPTFMVLLLIYFGTYIGLFVGITGGNPTMQLANFGDTYDRFYKTAGDVDAAQWIAVYKDGNQPVAADTYGSIRLRAADHPPLKILTNVTQEALSKNTLIYATSANLHSQIAYARYRDGVITYSFPEGLLESHKSVVYTNNESAIYR